MARVRAILLIMSCYIVYGLSASLGALSTDLDELLMKDLQKQAKRRLVPRHVSDLPQLLLRLQNEPPFDDPSLEDVVSTTWIRSNGVSETGLVTLEASFLDFVDHIWILKYQHKLIITKGNTHTCGSLAYTSLDVTTCNEDYSGIALRLKTKSFAVYIQFSMTNISEAGLQSVGHLGSILGAPNTTEVNENCEITFDICLPDSFSNVSEHLTTKYVYTDPSTEAIKIKILNYTYESNTAPDGYTSITIREFPDAIEGFLVLFIDNIDALTTAGRTSFFSMNAMAYIEVRSRSITYRKNVVHFLGSANDVSEIANYVTINDTIRYGSVHCLAQGHPKPTIQLSKDGQVLKRQYNSEALKFMSWAYVPLDGKTMIEAVGTYVCKATSGNETISKVLLTI